MHLERSRAPGEEGDRARVHLGKRAPEWGERDRRVPRGEQCPERTGGGQESGLPPFYFAILSTKRQDQWGSPLGLENQEKKKGGFGGVGRERLERGRGSQLKSFSHSSHNSPHSLHSLPNSSPTMSPASVHSVCIRISRSLCSSNPSSLYPTPVCLSPTLSPRPSPLSRRRARWTPCWTTRSCSRGDCAT